MRKVLLILVLVGGGSAPAMSFAPFAPFADVPDHVVTMVDRPGHGRETHSRTVARQGVWTRVDKKQGNHLSRAYFRDGSTEIQIYGINPDDMHIVTILRDPERMPNFDYNPFSTGERHSVLGETCTVWNVWRAKNPTPPGTGLSKLSCVTDDGIELWYKTVGAYGVISSAEAIRIERMAVLPTYVRPPDNLIAFDEWLQTGPPQPATSETPDHDVVLQREGPRKLTWTKRRHDGWTYFEETSGKVRHRLIVSHAARGLSLNFEADEAGAPRRLTLSRSPPPSDAQIKPFGPQDMNRGEVVLGEECRWFNMMPGLVDAGHIACLTHDGIALKEELAARGSSSTYVAVRFARRPIGLAEIAPPQAILDRRTWGLPE